MNEGATKEMPQYHCHKKVWALKITEIVGSPDTTGQGAYLHTEKDFAPIEVNAEWMTRHKPEIGGYYVVYKDGYKSYSPAEAFEDGYTLDMAEVAEWPVEADINAKLARLAHTVNKAYCEAIGDDSQVDWFNAPQWQRDSAIAGVEFVRNNPEAGPDASHNSWLRQKEADGWVYGCVKDPDKKQHPCMVSFEALPAEQQAKDHLFRAVVLGAAAM